MKFPRVHHASVDLCRVPFLQVLTPSPFLSLSPRRNAVSVVTARTLQLHRRRRPAAHPQLRPNFIESGPISCKVSTRTPSPSFLSVSCAIEVSSASFCRRPPWPPWTSLQGARAGLRVHLVAELGATGPLGFDSMEIRASFHRFSVFPPFRHCESRRG